MKALINKIHVTAIQRTANQLNKLYSWSAIEFIQLVCSSLYIETSIMCLINIIKIDKCKVLID